MPEEDNEKLFYVAYDILRGNPYQHLYGLYRMLKARGKAERVQKSVIALRLKSTAVDLRAYLKKYVSPGDRLLVIESADWASSNSMGSPNTL